jgi:hypothetical protein
LKDCRIGKILQSCNPENLSSDRWINKNKNNQNGIRRINPKDNWMGHEGSFCFGLWLAGSNLSKAMATEIEKQGLRFARELEMSVFYEGVNIGTRRVDFFVEDKIMTELKAVDRLTYLLNTSINCDRAMSDEDTRQERRG